MQQTSTFAQTVVKCPKPYVRGSMPTWTGWTVQEAADNTGYHPEYLRRLIRAGKIEAEKFGGMYIIRADSLQQYIETTQTADDARTGPKSGKD